MLISCNGFITFDLKYNVCLLSGGALPACRRLLFPLCTQKVPFPRATKAIGDVCTQARRSPKSQTILRSGWYCRQYLQISYVLLTQSLNKTVLILNKKSSVKDWSVHSKPYTMDEPPIFSQHPPLRDWANISGQYGFLSISSDACIVCEHLHCPPFSLRAFPKATTDDTKRLIYHM